MTSPEPASRDVNRIAEPLAHNAAGATPTVVCDQVGGTEQVDIGVPKFAHDGWSWVNRSHGSTDRGDHLQRRPARHRGSAGSADCTAPGRADNASRDRRVARHAGPGHSRRRTDTGRWMLRQPVAALARALSADCPVLYIVSETAGGPRLPGHCNTAQNSHSAPEC